MLLIGFYADGLFEGFIQQAEAELKISVRYLSEPKALGTGGGLHQFRDQIMAGNPDHFFVLHSDIYGDFQLENMLKAHVARGSAGALTMLAKKVRRISSAIKARPLTHTRAGEPLACQQLWLPGGE